MADILVLSLSWNTPLESLGGLVAVARALGHDLHCVEMPFAPGKGIPMPIIRSAIDKADGFLVVADDLVSDDSIRLDVQARVDRGARMLCMRGTPASLIAKYGIESTEFRIWNDSIAKDANPYVLSIEQPYAGPDLLKVGTTLHVQQPRLLRYSEQAGPLLVCPPESQVTNSGDRFVPMANREKAFAVAWPVGIGSTPRVIALAAGLFHDPYQGFTGLEFPGIEANKSFAEAVIRWLAGDRGISQITNDALQRVHGLELDVRDLAFEPLQAVHGAWSVWAPAKLRDGVAEAKKKRSTNLPEDAYLSLIDFRVIFEAHWDVFSRWLAGAPPLAKRRALKWLVRVNELRNLVSHPVALRYAQLATEDVEFLEERRSFVRTALQDARLWITEQHRNDVAERD